MVVPNLSNLLLIGGNYRDALTIESRDLLSEEVHQCGTYTKMRLEFATNRSSLLDFFVIVEGVACTPLLGIFCVDEKHVVIFYQLEFFREYSFGHMLGVLQS